MEHSIWTEKYRPSEFSEIIGQKDVVSRVKAFVEHKNMPHLLFTGPAGVGKTTLAIVVAKKLFGENWRGNFLELNASDERGIEVIRVKVKDFARTRSIGDVPFKIIYLDECDALTKEAQQALRRTMENFTQTCRFILSANYSSKIIEPIQSRCAIFRFKPLLKDDVFEIIERIAKNEKLSIDKDAKDALYEACEGDLRKLENIMQACASLGKSIYAENVFSMAAMARPKEVKEVLELAVKGDFVKARAKLIDTMLTYGISGLDMIKQIQKHILDINIDKHKKMELIDYCGEIEFRMTEGSDEYLQLDCLLARMGVAGK